MENSPVDILQSRVEIMETVFFNGKREESTDYAVALSSRLADINVKLNKLESSIPSSVTCSQLIKDLKPYILHSRLNFFTCLIVSAVMVFQ